MSAEAGSLFVVEDWSSPEWRLDHLYTIADADGREIPFRPNAEQRQFLANLHDRNLVLKARQLGYCLEPDTPVLTADLRWVAIGDIEVGTEVVAVDESVPGGRGCDRKMRTATVQAKRVLRAERFRITFDDGRSVVCTAQHPWLSRKSMTQAEWRSLAGKGEAVHGRLKVGSQVRWITKPWGPPGIEDGWFGGMLDGEGSMRAVHRTADVCVCQRTGPVWDRLVKYADERGYSACAEDDAAERPGKFGRVPVPKLAFGRLDELFRLLGQTRPTRFIGQRFWEGQSLPGKRSGVGWATITSIEPLGIGEVVDLQTSTHTYVANGFVSHNSTLLCLMALDQCLFNANFTAAIIAHSLDDASKLFRGKIQFAWERLPDALRSHVGLKSETASGMVFGNGSSISVDTSARSQTLQFLHVSEFGKICAKFPERAKEVVTGSFPAVSPGGLITIESTAEGQEGYFYQFTMAALAAQQEGRRLTPLDFRLHFSPWWAKPANRLDPEGVPIAAEMVRYFDKLEARGIRLSAEQRAWYVKTAETLHDDVRREHPSYAEEAFEVSIEGTILHHQMALLRKHGQITTVPWDPAYPVNTFWDLGTDDATAIWCHQRVGLQNRLIRYFEDSGQGLGYYANELRSHGFVFGTHYVPHDADNDIQGESVEKRADILRRLLPGTVTVVDRIREIGNGIEKLREFLPSCWIDQTNCADGIKCLDSYRYEWDDKLGRWKSAPLHNWASHACDALRQGAQGYRPHNVEAGFVRHRSSWRA